jgi:hypothetical protein
VCAEVEQIEKLALIARLPTHHDPPPPLNESSETESCHADHYEPFFDSIGQKRTLHRVLAELGEVRWSQRQRGEI